MESMNEPEAPVPPAPSPAGPERPSYSTRSLQLRIAGGILLFLGAMALMLFMLMRMMASLGPSAQQSLPPDQRADLHSAAYFYFALALFFVWTGFGALLLKRWVRPLMLSLMWPALIMGTLSFVTMAVLLPAIKQFAAASAESPAPGIMGCALGCTFALLFIIYMILPALFLALFQGDDVRLTLEAHDPSPSWTDMCPVPVFALSLWLFLIAFLRLMAPANHIMSFMGIIVEGRLLIILTAALFATKLLLAWGIYRLKKPAWWGLLVFYTLFIASSVVTYLKGDFMKLAMKPGGSVPDRQLELLQTMSTHYGSFFAVLSLIVIGASLAYIIYVKRFFYTTGKESISPPPAP